MKYSKKNQNMLIWGGILILLLILYVLNQFLGKENFQVNVNKLRSVVTDSKTCNNTLDKIYLNNNCRLVSSLTNQDCNKNMLIFENNVCRKPNPTNLSDCLKYGLIQNKEKTKCVLPKLRDDCSKLKLIFNNNPNDKNKRCNIPKDNSDCNKLGYDLYDPDISEISKCRVAKEQSDCNSSKYNIIDKIYDSSLNSKYTKCRPFKNNLADRKIRDDECKKLNPNNVYINNPVDKGCFLTSDICTIKLRDKTFKYYRRENENEKCCRVPLNGTQICNLDQRKVNDDGSITFLGGGENAVCNADYDCDSSLYYCKDKKCTRGTGTQDTICVTNGYCADYHDCIYPERDNKKKKTTVIENGKCIKDMNRFCSSLNRLYNNPEYDGNPNGCNENEEEKKKRCIEGIYTVTVGTNQQKNDGYIKSKKNVCATQTGIAFSDIYENTPTGDTYQNCMNERNCKSYNNVKSSKNVSDKIADFFNPKD